MSDAKRRPTRFRWNVFVMACGTSWFLYLHRYIFGLIKPVLGDEGLDNEQLGVLDSVFAFTYSVFQIPLGLATTALGVHLMLTCMLILWSVGLGMHAWASHKYLWTARAMLGIGQSAVLAAQSQITRTWFPRSIRTSVQGWLGVFFSRFGGLTANLIIGAVLLGVYEIPWRTVVYVMAALGVGHALLFAFCFRNKPRNHPRVNEAEADLIEQDEGGQSATAKPRIRITELFRSMRPLAIANVLALNLQTILSTMADSVFSNWIPKFLSDVHDLDFKKMGVYAALPLLGGALGGAFGGWLNDKLIFRTGSHRWSRTAVGAAGKGLAGVLLLTSLLFYNNPQLFCLMLFVVKFFSDWSLVTTWGCVTDMGGRTSATLFAFNNSVAGIGSMVAPLLFGAMAKDGIWVPVFVTAAGTYLACALTWLLINCEIPVIRPQPAEK